MSKSKMLILPAIAALGLTALTGCNIQEKIKEQEETVEYLNDNLSYLSKGIKVKMLSSGVDTNNHPYQTLSFTVYPADAYYQECEAVVSFADNRQNASSYITASVVNTLDNKSVTITCLQAFDSICTVTIQTVYGNASADITVNYSQKLVSTSFDSSTHFYHVYYDSDNVREAYANMSGYMVDTNKTLAEAFRGMFTPSKSVYTTSPLPNDRLLGAVQVPDGNSYYARIPNATEIGWFANGSFMNFGQSSYWQHCGSYFANALKGIDLDLNPLFSAGFYYSIYKTTYQQSGADTNTGSVYARLTNAINSMPSTDSYYLSDLLDSDGYIPIAINLTGFVWHYQSVSCAVPAANQDGNYYLVLHIDPLSSWISTRVTSISSESQSITF